MTGIPNDADLDMSSSTRVFLTVRGDRMVMSSPVGAKEITVGGEVDGWISVDRSGLLAVLRECDDPGVRICTAPFGQVVIEDRQGVERGRTS